MGNTLFHMFRFLPGPKCLMSQHPSSPAGTGSGKAAPWLQGCLLIIGSVSERNATVEAGGGSPEVLHQLPSLVPPDFYARHPPSFSAC